jgi:hypothetical protein
MIAPGGSRSKVPHNRVTVRIQKALVDGIPPQPALGGPSQGFLIAALIMLAPLGAAGEDNFASWPVLKSTFPSTGGGGVMIKGYDPVIAGGKCVTTFMAAVPPAELYFNVVEYDAVPAQGGTLCTNGQWLSFNGKDSGTTPFRMFFKDDVFRAQP